MGEGVFSIKKRSVLIALSFEVGKVSALNRPILGFMHDASVFECL